MLLIPKYRTCLMVVANIFSTVSLEVINWYWLMLPISLMDWCWIFLYFILWSLNCFCLYIWPKWILDHRILILDSLSGSIKCYWSKNDCYPIEEITLYLLFYPELMMDPSPNESVLCPFHKYFYFSGVDWCFDS